jgi:hypothetical protein
MSFLAINIGMFSSCKNSQYAAKRSQAKTDNMRKARVKQSQKVYDKASKEHLNRQDKATKKRIKKNSKDQKKYYNNNRSKGKNSSLHSK